MISGLLLIISTVNSKIVQGYAAINHQSLESTKCGDKKKIFRLSFSIFHTLTPSLVGWSGSCNFRNGWASKESVTLCRNDTWNLMSVPFRKVKLLFPVMVTWPLLNRFIPNFRPFKSSCRRWRYLYNHIAELNYNVIIGDYLTQSCPQFSFFSVNGSIIYSGLHFWCDWFNITVLLSKYGEQQLVMVNHACGFNQSETGKQFEWITKKKH